MKIAVVSPQVPKNLKELINISDYIFYACDKAVEDLTEQNIPIELAIGDFDSLGNLGLLKGVKTIKLNKVKDFSDTSYAIRHAYNQSDDVVLIGGVKGSRSDHFFANLLLLDKYNNLTIIDDTNKIFRLDKGVHLIKKENYNYLSIFPLEDAILTVSGTEYNLEKELLKVNDPLGLSNKITSQSATIELHEGVILVFQTK